MPLYIEADVWHNEASVSRTTASTQIRSRGLTSWPLTLADRDSEAAENCHTSCLILRRLCLHALLIPSSAPRLLLVPVSPLPLSSPGWLSHRRSRWQTEQSCSDAWRRRKRRRGKKKRKKKGTICSLLQGRVESEEGRLMGGKRRAGGQKWCSRGEKRERRI